MFIREKYWAWERPLPHDVAGTLGCWGPVSALGAHAPPYDQVRDAGSARTVNRRYIALFVAYKDRTWASALFVSLSAVGMALGPLLSLPLSLFPTKHFAGLTFDHVRPPTLLCSA